MRMLDEVFHAVASINSERVAYTTSLASGLQGRKYNVSSMGVKAVYTITTSAFLADLIGVGFPAGIGEGSQVATETLSMVFG